MQVHDVVAGTCATLRKEQPQQEIEPQLELGVMGLLQEDKYLLEINSEGLETTLNECQDYWLFAVNAGWEAKLLWEQQQLVCNSQQDCE
jgi:hypothetical protein